VTGSVHQPERKRIPRLSLDETLASPARFGVWFGMEVHSSRERTDGKFCNRLVCPSGIPDPSVVPSPLRDGDGVKFKAFGIDVYSLLSHLLSGLFFNGVGSASGPFIGRTLLASGLGFFPAS